MSSFLKAHQHSALNVSSKNSYVEKIAKQVKISGKIKAIKAELCLHAYVAMAELWCLGCLAIIITRANNWKHALDKFASRENYMPQICSRPLGTV